MLAAAETQCRQLSAGMSLAPNASILAIRGCINESNGAGYGAGNDAGIGAAIVWLCGTWQSRGDAATPHPFHQMWREGRLVAVWWCGGGGSGGGGGGRQGTDGEGCGERSKAKKSTPAHTHTHKRTPRVNVDASVLSERGKCTGCSRMLRYSSSSPSPSNGGRPSNISYTMTPSAQ